LSRVIFAVGAVSVLAFLPWLSRIEPLIASAVLLGLCVLTAMAASASIQTLSVMAGSVAALVGGMLFSAAPALSGALLLGLIYAERTCRVRGRREQGLHLVLALIGGALSASLCAHYLDVSFSTRGVAYSLVAVLVMLPFVLEADDPLAHELQNLGAELGGEVGELLRTGAGLRRDGDSGLLDKSTRREVRASWTSLIGVTRARARIETNRARSAHRLALIARLDGRIEQHVTALGRTFTAAQEVRAAEASLDDVALRNVETSGESLEQISRALVD
jgi:hypothetical protein